MSPHGICPRKSAVIVCHCFVVNDRRISELLDTGALSLADVRDACGASSDCGSCANTIRDMVAERRETMVSLV
ncbi:MAG: (2Fe-2S)-binding protein [Actinomycetota bacterium]